MARDLEIADRLRAWLPRHRVIEVDGWQTRGDDYFSPRGFVWHHTAGSRRGNAPSLGVVIRGRSDLPGPLCHVLQARDDTLYVVASGRANHAGRGGWNGLAGNSSVWGLEVENVGTSAEPWRGHQIETMTLVAAALLNGRADVANACRHAEWAPTRKVDTHSPPYGDALRDRTRAHLESRPGPETEEDDMSMLEDREWTLTRRGVYSLGPISAEDSIWKPGDGVEYRMKNWLSSAVVGRASGYITIVQGERGRQVDSAGRPFVGFEHDRMWAGTVPWAGLLIAHVQAVEGAVCIGKRQIGVRR